MTTIRTTCPRCGEVDMGPGAILLSVTPGVSAGSYRFVCPVCLDPVEKPADRRIVALLVSAGVDVKEPTRGLAEAAEGSGGDPSLFDDRDRIGSEDRSTSPPFTIDDVIQFHFLLRDDRLLEEFVSGS
jgi:hypothetical protein